MVWEEGRRHHVILMIPRIHLLLDMGRRHHVAATTIGTVEAMMGVLSWKYLQVPLLLLIARLTLVFRILFSVRRTSVACDALEVTCL